MVNFTEDVKLDSEAIKLLESLQTSELHVITLIGKYRTGKSYILNKVLLNQDSGFEVGKMINTCTKGFWIWPELMKFNDGEKLKECLIIDTEGLGVKEDDNTDIKIFILAVFLSSYLIYNGIGCIDQEAIKSLGLLVNLTHLFHNNNEDMQEPNNCIPSFLWLIRDFSLSLERQNGKKITSSEYLQSVLEIQVGQSQAAYKKNQVRKQLRTFFQNRDCFTLIRPTQISNDLRDLSSLSDSRLRTQFVELVSELRMKIASEVKPKNINGKPITPQGFIELSKYFTEAINSGKIPSINSYESNLCLTKSKNINENIRQLNQRLQNVSSIEININGDEINKIKKTHLMILKQAQEKIDKSFLGKLQKDLSKRLQEIWSGFEEKVLLDICEKNHLKVKQILSRIFEQTIKELKSKQIQSFQQIFQRFETLKQQSKGDTRIYELFYENFKDVSKQFKRNFQAFWEKQNIVCSQGEMLRNKCTEYITLNTKLNQQIQKLKNYIDKLQSNLGKNPINTQFKQISQTIVELNIKIKQLELNLQTTEMEKRNLNSLLDDERKKNQILLKASPNYILMKQNYEIQKKYNYQLKSKLQQLQIYINYCWSFQCTYCNQILDRDLIVHHHNYCIQQRKSSFDVTYYLNVEGQIQYIIEIKVDQEQWSVSKKTKAIRMFLQKNDRNSELFKDNEDNNKNSNLFEQQRIYLKEVIDNLGKRIWKQRQLIIFLALDIHILRPKRQKNQKILPLELQQLKEDEWRTNNLCLKTSRHIKKNIKINQFL